MSSWLQGRQQCILYNHCLDLFCPHAFCVLSGRTGHAAMPMQAAVAAAVLLAPIYGARAAPGLQTPVMGYSNCKHYCHAYTRPLHANPRTD